MDWLEESNTKGKSWLTCLVSLPPSGVNLNVWMHSDDSSKWTALRQQQQQHSFACVGLSQGIMGNHHLCDRQASQQQQQLSSHSFKAAATVAVALAEAAAARRRTSPRVSTL